MTVVVNGNKKLFLFTESFPFGKGETFIESEIAVLSKHFVEIIIFPRNKVAEPARDLPPNVKVNFFDLYNQPYSRLKLVTQFFVPIVSIFIMQFFLSKHKIKYLKYFSRYFNDLLNNYNRALRFDALLFRQRFKNGIDNFVFYSYWFDVWASVISILRYKKKINYIVTKTHGGDLFEERKTEGFFPFRSFYMSQIDSVVSVSEAGKKYMMEKYPKHNKKIFVSHNGVFDYGFNPLNESMSDCFYIVSCSGFISLKRVHLIVKILSQLKFKTHWIHFGDGPLRQNIISECLTIFKDNVSFDFKGHITNKELMSFYQSYSVDMFIHLSETEGLPVSIIEAIGFGIPVIATEVGGIPEIINEKTGFLLDANPDIETAVNIISAFKKKYEHDRVALAEFRFQIREEWKRKFRAEEVYGRFAKEILLK